MWYNACELSLHLQFSIFKSLIFKGVSVFLSLKSEIIGTLLIDAFSDILDSRYMTVYFQCMTETK